MNTHTSAAFEHNYLQTWIEPDPQRRRTIIDETWARDGRLSVSSLGLTLEGVDAISSHISGVHDDLIVGKGLAFAYDQHVESGDAVLLRWSMRAPTGDVVGRGVDIVFRNLEGHVQNVYMFMGVD